MKRPSKPVNKVRYRGRQNDVADPQPWRCAECGEAVSRLNAHGEPCSPDNYNDCACTRALKEKGS
jgi:hypothetical protein